MFARSITIKAALCFVIVASLSVSFFGVSHLGMGSMGAQGNCPFMPGHSAALCQANPLHHIQELQSMFTTLPQGSTILGVLLILAAALAVASFFKILFSPPLVLVPISISSYRFVPPRSILQEAYSRGILNTKAF